MSAESSKPRTTDKRRRRGIGLIKFAIVVLALLGLAVLAALPERETETTPGDPPAVNVRVIPVRAVPQFPDTFLLPAVVEPNEVVTVSAEVPGRIEWIGPTEGSPVRTGDLLVRLNTDLLQAEFERVQAQAEYDKTEFDRNEGLAQDGAAPGRDLDEAAMKLAVSRAQLEEVRARLKRTGILAPVSGVLNALPVEQGEYVQPGMPVAEIVNTDQIKVVVKVPERDVPFFEPGDATEVIASAKDDEDDEMVLQGPITFISELADEQTRSTRMEITLPNKGRLLRSGQVVQVRLQRRLLRDAILIPLLAVIPMENGNAVYIVQSSKAVRRDVVLGIIRGDQVRILSGLAPGDQLIVAGHRFVAPGQNVSISSPESEDQ